MASWRAAELASGVEFSQVGNILEHNVVFQSHENATTGGGWLKGNQETMERHGLSELSF